MKLRILPLVLGALALPALSSADFIWASLVPAKKTFTVGLTEWPGEKTLDLKERYPLVKAFEEPGKFLALNRDGNSLTGSYASDVVGIDMNYGVIDRKAQGRGILWLYYYAKAAATPEASQKKLGLGVEAFVKLVDGKPVVTVHRNGMPAAKATVVAEISPKEDPITLETGADGTVTLPAVTSGKLSLRALVQENEKGTEGGKGYELRRSYIALTIEKI